MPTEKRTETTGIFNRTTETTTGVEDMAEAFARFVEADDAARRNWPDTLRVIVENMAELAGCSIQHKPVETVRQLAERVAELRDAEDTPGPVRADAVTAYGAALAVLEACEKGHGWDAAREGLILGQALERMGVRPFEPDAKSGRKSREGGNKGFELAHGTREAKAKEYAEIRREWHELRKKNPDMNVGALDKALAVRRRVHPGTIKRARLKKPKKT